MTCYFSPFLFYLIVGVFSCCCPLLRRHRVDLIPIMGVIWPHVFLQGMHSHIAKKIFFFKMHCKVFHSLNHTASMWVWSHRKAIKDSVSVEHNLKVLLMKQVSKYWIACLFFFFYGSWSDLEGGKNWRLSAFRGSILFEKEISWVLESVTQWILVGTPHLPIMYFKGPPCGVHILM